MSDFLGLDKKGRLAIKNNTCFTANLHNALKYVGKEAIGVLAAEALVAAIKHTHQDSSRAAANWDLAIGGEGMRDFLSPHGYGTLRPGGGNEAAVIDYKAMVYGFGQVGPTGWLTLTRGGHLRTALKIGQPGSAPTIILFNPILSDSQKRREGWGPAEERTGNTYAQNAWPLTGPDAGVEGLVGKVSAAFTLHLRELNKKIHTAASTGRIETYE